MTISLEADHGVSHPERKGLQALWLIAASLLALFVLGVDGMAQDEPQPASTPHYVRSTPIPAGAMVPMPGIAPPHEHMLAIHVDGYQFMMWPGPCAFRVSAAIQAHQDLLSGDQACDKLIRQARTIQRQKEAEDPAYARAMHATPARTTAESGDDKNQQ